MTTTIESAFRGRDNNFNLIRFLAASAVLVDHCFWLVGSDYAAQAPIDLRPFDIGRYAVDVFFIVSGFLVTRSVMRQPTLIDYGAARVLRLFPALIVVCIATAFLLGPAISSLAPADYFAEAAPWLYVPFTASLISHTLTLPGVFENVPEAGVINSPLWTLRYEVFCYLLLGLFAAAGLFVSRMRGTAAILGVFALYAVVTFATDWRDQSAALDSVMRFLLDFFLGAALFVYRDRIRLSFGIVTALGLAALFSHGTPVFEAALRVAMAYGLIWLAFVPGGAIRKFNRAGDYSYGIYILSFPMQQTIVSLDPAIGPLALFAVAFPMVLGVAMLSWHCIEQPALRQKERAGAFLKGLLGAWRVKLPALLPTRA